MTDTAISWTHRPGTRGRTWNPTNGCKVVSPGCANCYAMRFAGRFSAPGQRYHGLVTLAKNRRAVWTGESRLESHMLALPLKWRSPSTVFVNSMSDLFYEGFSNEQIAAVFGVMAAAPQHTFQVLTKRARRMREWFAWIADQECDQHTECHAAALRLDADGAIHAKSNNASDRPWPLPNVWIGVSTENQETYVERVRELHFVPAAVHFISAEPLIGPIDMHADSINPGWLDWVIAGCESGPGARPCEVAWMRSLRDQCAASGVAYFLKQLVVDGRLRKDVSEFPADLQIQEFPQ